MKSLFSLSLAVLLLLPSLAYASVDVLAAGWWNASLEELISARMQIDNQIVSLGGQLPNAITPTPIPAPTPSPIIQYIQLHYITKIISKTKRQLIVIPKIKRRKRDNLIIFEI